MSPIMRLGAIAIGPKDESGTPGAPLARSGRGGWESEEEGARSRECRDALVLQKNWRAMWGSPCV